AAMVDKILYPAVFADVEFPSVAGRVTAPFRGILHGDQLGRAAAHRQVIDTGVDDLGAAVPVSLQGEQKRVVVVDETRVDIICHVFGLAAQLGALVGNFDRLAVFILRFIGDLGGLRLPFPCAGYINFGGV